MDYEKAYNEAIERAKQFMSEHPTRAEADLMVALFPELKESEDERTRKELVEKISKLACGCFISQEQKQNFIAYLEKQKDINCLACDEHLKGYLAGRKVTEEKQKELPFVKDVVLGYPGLYFYDGERMHFRGSPAMEENQKERKPVEIHIDNPNIEKFAPDMKITTSDSSADRKVYCEEVRDAFEPNSIGQQTTG